VAGLNPAHPSFTLETLQNPKPKMKNKNILALVTPPPVNLTQATACAPLLLSDKVPPLEKCLWPLPDRTPCSQSVIANSSARVTKEALMSLQEAMDNSSRALPSPPSPTVPARSADPLSDKVDVPFGQTGSVPECQSMLDYYLAAAGTATKMAGNLIYNFVLYNLDNAQTMEVEEEEIQYDRL
jgi:hypothetical protein